MTSQQQIDDKPGQIATLASIAQLYQGWGDNGAALEYLGQVLTIQRQTNDEAGVQATLDSMAKIEAGAGGTAPAPENPAAAASRPQPVEEKPAAPPAPVPPLVEKPVEAAAPVPPVEVKPAKPAPRVQPAAGKPAQSPPAVRPIEAVTPPTNPARVDLIFGTGQKKLTPCYLQEAILPLIASLGELQQVLEEIQGKPAQKLIIHSISQDAPIRASLEGVAQAAELVQELVIPWRQENAGQMAKLDEQQKQADIGRIRTELLEKSAAEAENQVEAEKFSAEMTGLQAEVEQLLQANEKIRQALYRAQVELALEVLSQSASRLGEVERIRYMIKLLAPLEALVMSKLEIRLQ